MKSGCSTAGCHGDEVSWEMQVGKQARHTHYSSSMRFFLMSFERGGQSGDCLGGSPLWIMILPSGRWQDNQTPTLFILKLLFGYASCKYYFGTMLAGVYHSMQKHLWGCAYRNRADYTSLFWETFRYRIFRKEPHVNCQENFSPQANIPQTHQLYNSCHYFQERTTAVTSLTKLSDKN